MAFFVPKRSASVQVGGPSGKRYYCSKDKPVEIVDQADIVNFRSRRDTLVETDASGNPVTPAPVHGGTITPADIGMAASYRKFGSAPKAAPVDPRVAGEATKPGEKPEVKVRRSSPKPVEPPKETAKAVEPEPEPEEDEIEDDEIEDSDEGDEDEDEDGGGE